MLEQFMTVNAYGIPQNIYEMLWLFVLYAFLGWSIEVVYQAVNRGIFVNRGFLNGPYCPMYGVGMVMVSFILPRFKSNIFILFIASFIFASALEFVTGFVLEKAFHNKWWDYSNVPFNLMGYICLKFSIYWGIGGVLMFTTVHPMIYSLVKIIPHIIGVIFLIVFYVFFTGDLVVTVMTILKFNNNIKLLNEMAQKMHSISDGIGEKVLFEGEQKIEETKKEFEENHEEIITKVSETTEAAKNKITQTTEIAKEKIAETTGAAKDKIAETAGAAKDKIMETTEAARNIELQELQEKYKEILSETSIGIKRLVKAFPNMTSKNNNEILQKYKEQFNIKRK